MGPTRVLMVGQACRGSERLETRHFFMIEHLPEGLDDHGTFVRKHLFKLGELASAMGQTVTADQQRFIRCITHERIRHHQRLVAPRFPVCQQRLQVLPRMSTPRHIQADGVLTLLDHQSGGVHACPRLRRVISLGAAVFRYQR